MRIRFWGTRGSIPTPGQRTVRYGGNTACVEVRDASNALLVLDAGTGLRELGLSLEHGGPLRVDLLLSHLHWDHIQGIPFFRPAYDPKSTLRIHGPAQHCPLREMLGLGMDDPFFPVDLDGLPVQLEVHDMKSEEQRRVGPYDVRATPDRPPRRGTRARASPSDRPVGSGAGARPLPSQGVRRAFSARMSSASSLPPGISVQTWSPARTSWAQ